MDSIQRIKFSLILSYRATVSFKCIKVFFYHDDAVRDVFFRDPRVRGFPFLLLHLATSVSLPFERFPLSGRFFFSFSSFWAVYFILFQRYSCNAKHYALRSEISLKSSFSSYPPSTTYWLNAFSPSSRYVQNPFFFHRVSFKYDFLSVLTPPFQLFI